MIATVVVLTGCAAHPIQGGAESVELTNDQPSAQRCRYLGEVVGSQGNWLTGDFTPNKNLVIGARNQLRNEARALGGNLVYVQDHKNTNAWGSMGTTNTTVVGKAYACR